MEVMGCLIDDMLICTCYFVMVSLWCLLFVFKIARVDIAPLFFFSGVSRLSIE
jgi:hypothetical protein